MINAILGEKKRMTQVFTRDGKRVPATVVNAGPVVITGVKTLEKDGYEAVQLGFGEKKIKNIKKPILGHLRGAISKLVSGEISKLVSGEIKEEKVAPRFLKEVRGKADLKVGDVVTAQQVLEPGDLVKVSGISKGKGFAGVVKRWGFAGGPRTHGQSDRERAPGSIGQTTTPGRVYKGKKMAGRMGGEKVTVKNLTVLDVNPKTSEVLITGNVPGNRGQLLRIEKIGKAEKFAGLARVGEEIHPEIKQVQALPKEKEEEKPEVEQAPSEQQPEEPREEKP